MTRIGRMLSGGALVGVLSLSLAVINPTMVRADDLDDEKARIQSEIGQSKQNLNHYTLKAEAAEQAYRRTQVQLAQARAELEKARSEVSAARTEDARLAAELSTAQGKLAVAKAEAAASKARLEAWEKESGTRLRQVMARQNPLSDYVVLFSTTRTSEINMRAQWSRTILSSTSVKLDKHRQLKLANDAKQAAAAAAEKKVSEARQRAAEQLSRTEQLAHAAKGAEQRVSQANEANAQAKAAAAAQVQSEEGRLKSLEADNARVTQRIKARIAAEKARIAAQKAAEERRRKAEAAERARRAKAAAEARARAAEAARRAAAAERKARAARTAAAKAEAARARAAANRAAANQRRAQDAARQQSPKKTTTRGNTSSASNGLIYPVNGPITSAYGMRFHPVLHRWKLHDGTDFGAGCGTPLRAAADGVVTERYYNGGYGNRLMIDHGKINRDYITTGYNHAIRYTVSVGERVRQGEVIGYVGSTGYSTGCHLHLMVWKDGDVVNPMSVF